MGTAVVAGVADYSYASKNGMLRGLYEEEVPATNILASRDVTVEDYSRGPIGEEYKSAQAVVVQDDQPKKKARKKIKAPVPPPPPPVIAETDIPPPPPPVESDKTIVPPPPPPAPPVVAEAPPAPVEVAEKEVSFESFSRAPLKYKKPRSKKSRN